MIFICHTILLYKNLYNLYRLTIKENELRLKYSSIIYIVIKDNSTALKLSFFESSLPSL